MLYFRIQEDTGTPAYQQIVDAICDAVRDGRLGVGDQLPTENEMAAMLGVSRPTVSRGYERLQLMGVLAQTRGRGSYIADDVFERLGIASRKPMLKVGFVVSAIGRMSQVPLGSRHITYDAIEGVIQQLEQTHATLTYVFVGQWNDHPPMAGGELDEFAHRLREYDGLLMLAQPGVSHAILPAIRASERPCVSLYWELTDQGVPSVFYDRTHAVRLAADHLAACGYRDIGFIGPSVENDGRNPAKLTIFTEALKRHNLSLSKKHTWFTQIDSVREQVTRCLEQNKKSLPEAFFVATDIEAMETISVFREHGVDVPGDVDIMGYDGLPETSLIQPALTSVQVPRHEIGEIAAQMLLNWPTDGSRPKSHRLEAALLQRDTCRIDARIDASVAATTS